MKRALVPAALLLAGCSAERPARTVPEPETPVAVTVVLSEWRVVAVPERMVAGTVVFHVRNAGNAPHDLVVARAGAVRHLRPGGARDLALDLPAGRYELFCDLPGHAHQGMRTAFTVSAA